MIPLATRALPSRAHAAGTAALAAGAALAFVSPSAALAPLAAFVAACLVAPFFPRWSFFLPTIARGAGDRRAVAVTFDDGPDPRSLAPLLALLARERVPATFFLVGDAVEACPGAVEAIVAGGHEIGNHSRSHDSRMMFWSVERLEREIVGCQEVLARRGVTPLVFRSPVGATNPRLLGVLRRHGLSYVGFRWRSGDYGDRRLRGLRDRVLSRVAPGDIVVLHDLRVDPGALEAWLREVEGIVAGLRADGYEIVPLSTLMGQPTMRLGGAAPEGAPSERPSPSPSAPPPRGRGWAIAAEVANAALLLGYPFLATAGLALFGTRTAALILLGAVVVGQGRRILERPREGRAVVAMAALIAAPLLVAAWVDDPRFMLGVPTLVNFALLAQFGLSLRSDRPMVERFARLQVDDLSPAEIRYCRTVTLVWCAFFVLNGTAAAGLALLAPRSWWAVYTGAVSYALMGALFAVEYVVRKVRFGRFGRGLLDRLLSRALRRVSPQ